MIKSDIENSIFEVVKEKTNIRGYWRDNSGKLFKDNIILYKACSALDVDNKIFDLFFKGEKCVFIHGVEKSYIVYKDNTQDVLTKCVFLTVKKLKASVIKDFILKYGGCTIFKNDNDYFIEAWTK